MDGEGCVTITQRCHPKYRQGAEIFPSVMIGQGKKELMDWLTTNFGGHYYTRKTKFYVWIVTHKKAVVFLQLMYPYLLLKKHQAKHCIALGLSKCTGKPLAKTQIIWQQRQLYIVQNLNSNGKGQQVHNYKLLKQDVSGHRKYGSFANKVLLGVG